MAQSTSTTTIPETNIIPETPNSEMAEEAGYNSAISLFGSDPDYEATTVDDRTTEDYTQPRVRK